MNFAVCSEKRVSREIIPVGVRRGTWSAEPLTRNSSGKHRSLKKGGWSCADRGSKENPCHDTWYVCLSACYDQGRNHSIELNISDHCPPPVPLPVSPSTACLPSAPPPFAQQRVRRRQCFYWQHFGGTGRQRRILFSGQRVCPSPVYRDAAVDIVRRRHDGRVLVGEYTAQARPSRQFHGAFDSRIPKAPFLSDRWYS